MKGGIKFFGRSTTLDTVYRFSIAVGISASITIALPILLVNHRNLAEEMAVAIAMIFAVFVNFFVNKLFVFRNDHWVNRQFLRFLLTNVLMRFVDYLGFLLVFRWFGLHYIASLIVVLSLTTVARFLLFSRIFSKD